MYCDFGAFEAWIPQLTEIWEQMHADKVYTLVLIL